MKMESGSYYHIYNRGNNREAIFREDENHKFFLYKYKKYLSPFVDTFAYCLMPNHFHFLIRIKASDHNNLQPAHPGKLSPLELAFRNLFIGYSKSFNDKYGRTGSLFQRKFKRIQADEMAYRMRLVVYIHANPIRAGLCQRYEQWKYSSYRAILGDGFTSIERDEVLDWFGNRENFRAFHMEYMDWEPD
jgi:REP element-mobilizing transposase RayT